LRFVAKNRVIRLLLVGLAVTTAFGFSIMTLMPAWATEVLHGDARTNGYLLSARGLGSLLGALMVASFGHLLSRGRMLAISLVLLPLSMAVFALARGLSLAFVTLVFSGWVFMIVFNMLNSLIQLHAPDALRGRVMSVYSLTYFGLMPIGSMLVGAMAGAFGAPPTVIANAFVVLVFAVVLWWGFPGVRRLE